LIEDSLSVDLPMSAHYALLTHYKNRFYCL